MMNRRLSPQQKSEILAAFDRANEINEKLQLAMDEIDRLFTEAGVPDQYRSGGLSDFARVMVFDELGTSGGEYMEVAEFLNKF